MKPIFLSLGLLCSSLAVAAPALPAPSAQSSIVLIGGGLGDRMQYDGYFETLLHLRYPERELTIRNMCFPGDTAAYRPRAGRNSQWAFPGAEKLRPEFQKHRGNGIEPSPDEWLAICKADTIVAFFGYNESFDGPAGVDKFSAELEAWIAHTRSQKYNGKSAPAVVLVSPIAFENLSAALDLPDGKQENANLALYTEAMRKVAEKTRTGFVDLFNPSIKLAADSAKPITTNGFLPSDEGNRLLAPVLADALYGPAPVKSKASVTKLREAVIDKAWHWRNDYRMTNGVHVYGRRRAPFGTVNYPPEIEKLRQMTANRDRAVWAAANGKNFDLETADRATRKLDPVESNFKGLISFRNEDDSLKSIKMMDGFKIELFATEERFPDLKNPVQMSFDNRGRLWVSVMPGYPHYRPGDGPPDDKILIFEDTNGDGKADKQTVFADKLHLPIGFELQPEGVYVTQQPSLMLLRDTNGDDKADQRELILHGFDSHDTHHAIGAYCADPGGNIYLAEGTFLHSQVETAYGPRRDIDSGVWRFEPRSQRLERYSQTSYANPWGIAFDDWGQCFLSDASNGQNWWELPLSVKVPFGYQIGKTDEFAPKRARPTSGSEFISSRHFPDELQGGFMVNNVIGFLGTSIHDIKEDGSGFDGKHRGDLLTSNDPNFRPVDLEFAPDGSLYLVDWHNPLIGHMQHSARDPKRDHDHGRIYRITYPSRPLVKPVPIAGAPVADLFKALQEPEYRTRYRARRELRGRDAGEVMAAMKPWLASLDPNAPRHEHHLCEALWTTWGLGQINPDLLKQCLNAKSHQARAAAVDVIRFSWRKIPDHAALLQQAATDTHPRVRLAAMVAASWLDNADGAKVAVEALERPLDFWMTDAFKAALVTLKDDITGLAKTPGFDLASKPRTREFLDNKLKLVASNPAATAPAESAEPKLAPADLELYRRGKEVYSRETHCATCHQPNGLGDAIYPPLAGSEWVTGDETRLIKIVLKGLWGPITVKGKVYDPKNGVPPMIGFEPLLKDDEVAGVLTYIRNSFGNSAPAVKPEAVKKVREAIKDKKDFYTVDDLLKQHPF
jgi:mono/diheme cytochrome c family protein/glucose/arabinose dehydrogenase